MKKSFLFALIASSAICVVGCDGPQEHSSDDIQRAKQETVLKEGAAACGIPNIQKFREMRMLKEVYELRDQASLITYTYLENVVPKVVVGHTACGGKLHFIKESISYGIPAATQYTNPQKVEWIPLKQGGYVHNVIPQADPNGLFSPASAEGTWIMMNDPEKGKAMPQYGEPRLFVFTFKFPFDTIEDLKASGVNPVEMSAEKR